MIEQVMVFALGFLIAGLAALAFAPVFWARAVRLSMRRLEMQLPLSMREVLADRDQVRAQAALEQRRIELKAEAISQTRAGDLAELGRRAVRIAQMQEHISVVSDKNTELSLDLAQLRRAHAELSAEASALTKELYDLDGFRNREKDKFAALLEAHSGLMAFADEQKASLASLSACGAALEVRLADTERTLSAVKTMLANKEAEATLLSSHLDRTRDDLQTSDAAHRSSVERYETEKGRRAELEERLRKTAHAQEESASLHKTLSAKLEARERDLHDAMERENDVRLKYEALTERMRSSERGLMDRIDRLRAENAALQGALSAARQECTSLSRDLSALRAPPGQKTAAISVPKAASGEASEKVHPV